MAFQISFTAFNKALLFLSFLARVFSRERKSQLTAALVEFPNECSPSSEALPFRSSLSSSLASSPLPLPVAIAPCWIVRVSADSLSASLPLQQGAPVLSYFLYSFLPFFLVRSPSFFPTRLACCSFLLCSSHFRPHSSLGNVDLLLTSSSRTGKEARPLEIVRRSSAKKCVGNRLDGKKKGFLIVFFSFFKPPSSSLPPGISQWKMHWLFIYLSSMKSGAKTVGGKGWNWEAL